MRLEQTIRLGVIGAFLLAGGAAAETWIVDGYVPDMVQAENPAVPTFTGGLDGGLDAGQPGDARGFMLARADPRWKHDNPDALHLFFTFAGEPADVTVQVGYRIYTEGTKLARVRVDGKEAVRFRSVDDQYRMIQGQPGLGEVTAAIAAADLGEGPIHETIVEQYESWGLAIIDTIVLRGEGLRLVHPQTKQALTEEDLAGLVRSRTPHLPELFVLPAGCRAFDFGPPDAPVWTVGGFVGVTAETEYTEKRGYGWAEASPELQHGRVEGLDDLRGDFVFARTPEPDGEATATFRVAVPRGRYRVYFIIGGVPWPQDYSVFQVTLEGTAGTGRRPFPPAGTARRPFPTLIERYVCYRDALLDRPAFAHRTVSVEVNDGVLDLRFHGAGYFLINALIVAPEAAWPELEVMTRRLIKDYYLPRAIEIQPPMRETDFAPTEEERARGYVLFAPSPVEPVYPGTRPPRSQWVGRHPPVALRAAAAPGEYEPVCLGVVALRDLPGVRVAVAGEVAAWEWDVRRAAIMPLSPHTGPAGQYLLGPRALVPVEPFNLPAGTAHVWWLTVRVPDDAAPGEHAGEVRLEIAGPPEITVPLVITVRPFRLLTPPDRWHGVWWASYQFVTGPEQHLEAQFADMQRHGLTSATAYLDDGVPQIKRAEDGTVQYDFTRQEQLAGLRQRYGLTGPVPVLSDWARVQQLLGREGEGLGQLVEDEAFQREYVALVKAMRAAAQQRGERWLFYPVDEPSAAPEVLNPIQRLLALAQQSGAQTFVTVREYEGKELGPWLDAICWGLGSVNERSLAATRAAGKPLYCYSGGYGLNPAHVRVQSGFYYWKIDARWMGFWVYCWPKGDPWFDLDNDMRETGFVFPGEKGPVPTIQYEALREGIDDLKYLYTLDQLVGRAARHADPAARRAATDAAMLVADQLTRLPFDGSELGAAVESLPPETWDAWREAVAAQIVRLREALGN